MEIIEVLALLFEPGQVTELRALGVSDTRYRKPHTVSGYYDDWGKLAEAAMQLDHDARGVYVVLNPVNPALLSRAKNRVRNVDREPLTSDTDIIKRRWLPIDCDPVRPSGISSSDVEHAAAIARAKSIRDTLYFEGWPDPILADSGNGAHLLYRIDEPADDGGLTQRTLQGLAARFSNGAVAVDTMTFNPARIWKLYGTTARKGDNTSERPHRISCILEVPSAISQP